MVEIRNRNRAEGRHRNRLFGISLSALGFVEVIEENLTDLCRTKCDTDHLSYLSGSFVCFVAKKDAYDC